MLRRFAFGKGHDSVPRGIASRKGTQPLPSATFVGKEQPFPGRTPSAFSAESRTACEARRPCFCYGIPGWSSITRSFTRVKAPAGNLLSLSQEV